MKKQDCRWSMGLQVSSVVLCIATGTVGYVLRADDPLATPESTSTATQQRAMWELDPLRVHCVVCLEGASAWNDTRRQSFVDGMVRRCSAEFGQTWRASAEVATPEHCALIAQAVEADKLEALEPFAESDPTRDKWLLLMVRVSGPCPTLATWEYDVVSRRWSDGPVRPVGDWQRLGTLAFESLAEVCSPQALVKSIAGPRVVLRLRGGLLPIPNARRAVGGVGAVFQVFTQQMRTFVRVERRDGHLLECRVTGEPLPDQVVAEAKGLLAVEVRTLHAATQLGFQLEAGETASPLIGCEVWAGRHWDEPGTFMGRTDKFGRVPIAREDVGVVWLHLRRGAVSLESVPVVPGYCQQQRIASHVRPGLLHVAESLALCCDDLSELEAVRESFRARVVSREAAGQVDQARTLKEEGRAVMSQRVDALHQRWQMRKTRAEQVAGPEWPRASAAWQRLVDELNGLRPPQAASPAQ